MLRGLFGLGIPTSFLNGQKRSHIGLPNATSGRHAFPKASLAYHRKERALTKYLTTEEVAETLRTSPETVRFWRHVGKGPRSFKVGRRVLYARADVEAFIAAARNLPIFDPRDGGGPHGG